MKYCDDCLNLTPTEEEQRKLNYQVLHWCRRLKVQLFHGEHHPRLPRPEECDDYKRRPNEKES